MLIIRFALTALLTFTIALIPVWTSTLPAHPTQQTFSPESNRTEDVTLPIDSRYAEIVHMPFIEILANGKGLFKFLVDSGAEKSFVSPEVAKQLGLELKDATAAFSSTGRVAAQKSSLQSIRLGTAELRDQPISIVPLPKTSPPLQGVVGYPLFERFVVKIDYSTQRLTLIDPKGYKYSGSGIRLPLVFLKGDVRPYVKLKFDGIEGTFLVDTGFGGGGLSLFSPFVQKNRLLEKYPNRISVAASQSIAGIDRSWLTRSSEIDLGGIPIRNQVVSFESNETSPDENVRSGMVSGMLGGKILSQFTVIVDHSRKSLILEKNSRFDTPDRFRVTGASILKSDQAATVIDVIDKSPAAHAGIRKGDHVLEINQRNVAQFDSLDLIKTLNTSGESIQLKIQSGSKIRDVTLLLQDLI